MAYKNLLTLHNEHRHWLNEFDLYQDEIKYFQHQLAKKTSQLQNQELKDDAHYFKTQWLQILSTIDDFRHKVYTHEARLYRKLELANRTKDHVITDEEHHTVKGEMEEFSMQYKALKQRFQEFIMS
ncbi:hypothetical protein [Catalinimonas niigatensis]|uniref:hypothetical protein n=1 Tax=Catalinimonas niigatensis TaxID=1397264 RepID=UPI002665B77D|nr:hypothetical protein [Catalinimonas niigatensis]WPP52732.1 hypothetical protein PZB72_10115 [Catalinimonas niigatensis]